MIATHALTPHLESLVITSMTNAQVLLPGDIAMGFIIIVAILAGAFITYFLPGITAKVRKHRNYNAILFLNLVLGWTLIGWIVCMAWSLTANTETSRA